MEAKPSQQDVVIDTVVGTVGLYDDVNQLVDAAAKVRDAGFKNWDCHTPYPVHGLDAAMGVRPSRLPVITLLAGLGGFLSAIALQGGISVFQYPLNSGGKPLFSWPAFVPIMFEMFVLFAAVATFVAMIWYARLGRWHSPLHDSNVMKDVTCDRFCIVLDATDPVYSPNEARALLEETGCRDVRPLIEKITPEEFLL